MKKTWLLAAVTLILLSNTSPASADFGTGIGITFPMGSSSAAASGHAESYASFCDGRIVQELTVTERRGRLVLELKVTNISDQPCSIDHRTGQIYDFVILDKNGKSLYRWSDGMAFTQALATTSYPPHESAVYTAELDRKSYRDIKEAAAFASACLSDTQYSLTTRIPTASTTASNPAVLHGGIIIGRGNW